MPRLSAAVVATLALAQFARADWQMVSSEGESSGAIEHRHLVMERTDGGERAMIDLALFSAKSTIIRVIDNANATHRLDEAMTQEHCLAGVNGGYFDTTFKPIGLRVMGGAIASPLVRARLLTGVLCASSRGVDIVRLAEFSRARKVQAAIECGPFLVDGQARVLGLDDKRRARRTFAAVASGGKAMLGVSSELTLAQITEILGDRSLANDFRIRRALNLDGGSSSAFWFKRNDGSAFSISEEKAVRDFVGVAAK